METESWFAIWIGIIIFLGITAMGFFGWVIIKLMQFFGVI